MARARKGGEIGMNGERYEGGQFLPSTELPKMVRRDRSAPRPRRVEVAPYVWETAPEGMTSIYQVFAGKFGRTDYNGKLYVNCSDVTLAYFKRTRAEVEEMAERYNNGEKWIKINR